MVRGLLTIVSGPGPYWGTDYGVTPERRLPTAAGFIERVTGLPVMRPTTYWVLPSQFASLY
jgi:hypothetical protein